MNTNSGSVSIAIRKGINLVNQDSCQSIRAQVNIIAKEIELLTVPVLNIGLPNVKVQKHA